MDLFAFVAWVLLTVVAVAIAWPVNVPLLALAVKVRRANEPLGYGLWELAWRSALGSFGVAVLAAVVAGLAYGLIVELDFGQARGPVHVVLFMVFVAAGVAYLYWVLALDDLVEAASIFFLYLFLPGMPLFLLGALLGLGGRAAEWAPWLAPAAS